ncbi:MAG: SIMPL domain-containing protein [Paludibacteraceae bacterium]|nr:SIMPL domain-containing protein [Paludibacteraceae bacterium]
MKDKLFPALVIALGIALSGLFIYMGIHQFSNRDRAVAVKGLSTRTVKADYVVSSFRFSVSGNDLVALSEELSGVENKVRTFFLAKGFKESDLSLGNIDINDNWNGYYEHRPANRYTISRSLIIATEDVDKVVQNQGCQVELLSQDVILNSNSWDTDYQFNGLSELKPEMVEEATKNARAVAQKFADDAQCSLGSIRSASQGQFSVESDSNQPWMKAVRVVTTVDYYLK